MYRRTAKGRWKDDPKTKTWPGTFNKSCSYSDPNRLTVTIWPSSNSLPVFPASNTSTLRINVHPLTKTSRPLTGGRENQLRVTCRCSRAEQNANANATSGLWAPSVRSYSKANKHATLIHLYGISHLLLVFPLFQTKFHFWILQVKPPNMENKTASPSCFKNEQIWTETGKTLPASI